jgi:hypothetical protein
LWNDERKKMHTPSQGTTETTHGVKTTETPHKTQDNKFVYVVKKPPLLSRNKPPGEGVQWWGKPNKMYVASLQIHTRHITIWAGTKSAVGRAAVCMCC